jgi:hypothetical protein
MGALLFGQGQLTAEFGGSATPRCAKDGHAATLHLRGARQEQLKSPAFAPQRKPSLRAKKKPQRLGYK